MTRQSPPTTSRTEPEKVSARRAVPVAGGVQLCHMPWRPCLALRSASRSLKAPEVSMLAPHSTTCRPGQWGTLTGRNSLQALGWIGLPDASREHPRR